MNDFWERYQEYLESDWWKSTRKRCIQRYDGKCFCCNHTDNLQVHHLIYDHLGFERDEELICLCRNCHEWIEEQKKLCSHSLTIIEQTNLLEERKLFFRKNDEVICLSTHFAETLFLSYLIQNNRDLSSHGDLNLTNISVIREEFNKWSKQNNVKCGKIPVMRIIEYFRNRRYEIILKFKEGNYPESICYNRTLFSKTMIHKVYVDPEQAQRLLNMEKGKNDL